MQNLIDVPLEFIQLLTFNVMIHDSIYVFNHILIDIPVT